MVSNPVRRAAVTDAALLILGRDGSRALTHRAVDTSAALPAGTSANYFPSRASLVLAMAHRIFERLAPTPAQLETLAQVATDDAIPEYVGAVVERLLLQSHLARALIELRLEASRAPEVAEVLTPVLRQGLRDDIAFHGARGLSGGAHLVEQLHHLVNGIVLDHLTIALNPDSDPVFAAKEAARLLAHGSESTNVP
ncbi:TetR/AcrR family transcriptional regulator [Agrococcus sp. ProA11]|uniref:TetR/AcrR family transcriptional regulator n=1 Tax=Agrococcus chionoecetis TaxID=3153752 RepID=UPI00326049F3